MADKKQVRITHKPSGEIIAEDSLGWDITSFEGRCSIRGKTLHQKLRELGTTGIQGPAFYNYKTGELMGSERLHNTECSPEKLAAEGRTQGVNMVNKEMTHFNTQTGTF